MTDLRRPKIAIVGGGLSGLATAAHLHLADPTLRLSLFESNDRIGGVIQTETIDSFVIDHGADMFAAKPSAAIEFCQQIGVEDQLIQPQMEGRGARIVRHGKLVPIPDGFVLMRATKTWPILTTPLLSLKGKLKILTEQYKPNNVSDEDQSVANFVRHRMGNEVLDRLVGPLVAGIYTADIEKLSLLATMGPIASMVRTHGSLGKATTARRITGEDSDERNNAGARYNQFRAFNNGMRQLIDSIENILPDGVIRTSSRIDALERLTSSSRWRLRYSGNQDEFDHVVVATPAAIASSLLAPYASAAASRLSEIETASTAIVILGVKKSDVSRPVNTFGFVVPLIENRQILAGSFASNKFARRAPEDHLLVRVFIGGSMQSHLLDHDDDQLIRIARTELAELIGLKGEPVLTKVVRWNGSMPQYHVGHLDRVKEIEADVAKVRGLSLMTNSLNGVGIAPVIASAKKTASLVRQEVSQNTNHADR